MVHLVRSTRGPTTRSSSWCATTRAQADVLYGVPFATYQAYNNYGGKSLYTFNSTGDTTVSGTARAVKVSYDRPFQQPAPASATGTRRDECAMVSWLEQQGYDVSYISTTDLDRNRRSRCSHHAVHARPPTTSTTRPACAPR